MRTEKREAHEQTLQGAPGPWSAYTLSRGESEIRKLAHQKASPLVVAERLCRLKEELERAREYERFDFRSFPRFVEKANYAVVDVLWGPTATVSCIELGPFGSIFSADNDGAIWLWRKEAGDEVWSRRMIGKHERHALTLRALPDGRVLSGSNDLTFRLWSVDAGGEWTHESIGEHDAAISCVQALPDGRFISGTWDGHIRIWSRSEHDGWIGESEWTSETVGKHGASLNSSVNCLQAFPNGALVSGADKGDLRYWSRNAGGEWEYESIGRHDGNVYCLQLLPDGGMVSGSADRTLCLWTRNEEGRWEWEEIGRHGNSVSALHALSARTVVSSSWDGSISLWKKGEGGKWERRQVGEQADPVNSVLALPDGRIVSASTKRLFIWDDEPARV